MNANVDLRELAVRRDEPAPRPSPRRRQQLVARYLLPGTVLLGFAGLIAWSARGSLLPSRPVTVVPVVTTRAEVQQTGAPLFQAAGWVEPRPTPTVVTALADGVVDKLLVVEGQDVKAGEPVARLIEADARLLLGGAGADLRLREIQVAGARARLAAVRARAANPNHLEAALAESEAQLARGRGELANLPFRLRSAEARRELARLDLEGKKHATSAIPARALSQAESDLEASTAAVEELKGSKPRLEDEVAALERRRAALRQQLELKTDELRQLAEAEATVNEGEARVEQARNAVEAARLRLERMTVTAPTAGRVLALVARPGMRVSGLAPGSLYDASTVVTLYDPSSLQARADVPLEQVSRVTPGQQVRIETEAVPGVTLEGEVLLKTSQADVQKNTLQVKVAVKSPPADLRPDMLVRMTFLAPPTAAEPKSSERVRLMVPRQVVETAEGGPRVWVADQVANVARARPVKLGQAVSGDLVEILEGLAETDRLIAGGREGLTDGERITVTGEDTTLGVAPAGAGGQSPRVNRVPAAGAAPKAKGKS